MKRKIVDIIGCLLIIFGIAGVVLSNTNHPAESSKIHLLCIGVDKTVPMDERVEYSNSIGQADGIFLLAIDTENKTVDIVSIPRDTIVTIEKYYSNMEYIGQEDAQICLQYAYADGLENSCELMADRVEEVFEGIEIDGYISMNLSALYAINDAVGGVTVTVNESIVAAALGVEQGSEVRLDAENMPYYIRTREKQESAGAYARTLRYKEYITSFIPQGIAAVKADPSIVLSLLEILKEHTVTNIQASDIVSIVTTVASMSMEQIEYHTLEGNIKLGADGYEEFYPDKWKLNELKKQIY